MSALNNCVCVTERKDCTLYCGGGGAKGLHLIPCASVHERRRI